MPASPSPFHALAVDFDGTLTLGGHPDPPVLEALAGARRGGMKLVLVTGRRLDDLRRVFPDVSDHFDALVLENGALLLVGRDLRTLAHPVDHELDRALAARGVPLVRGQVILDTSKQHAPVALEEIGRLGLPVQLIRNRDALMLTPSGVCKGQGLFQALGELGVSYHSTIAVGDAENDHSLLDTSELGVAVANAVPSLRERADVVLGEPAGRGIIELLGGPLLRGDLRVWPRRWRAELGVCDDGRRVFIPTSPSRTLIVGPSGAGKSYLAGLFAERLIALGYSVCVLDPEGDHDELAGLRGVTLIGGAHPSAGELARVLRRRFASAVFDLSQVAAPDKATLLAQALAVIGCERRVTGHPQWILVDEAQLGADLGAHDLGLCLVTYQPEHLPPELLAAADFVLRVSDDPEPARATLEPAGAGATSLAFTVAARSTRHVRHLHKYSWSQLPPHERFHFRGGDGRPTGHSAGNLAEFHRELAVAPDDSLRHHARHQDFSRWLRDVFKDEALSAELRALEQQATAARPNGSWRSAALAAVARRYLGASA